MEPRKPNDYMKNMALAGIAGQSGCVTAMVVIGALLLGMWLDATFDTKPAFTLGLVLTSVPLSLVMMVYMTLSAAKRITPPKTRKKQDKDEGGTPL